MGYVSVFISVTMVFACGVSAAATVKVHPVDGSCKLVPRKEKVSCPFDLMEDPPREVTVYEMPLKASAKIKTTSASCSEKLVAEIMKVREQMKDPAKADPLAGIRFDPEACTLLSSGAKSPQLAILELREFEKTTSSAPETLHRQIYFVHVDPQGAPPKIIKSIVSTDASTREKALRQLYGICDTDGDDQAEVVLSEDLYSSAQFNVLKLSPDFNEVSGKTYLVSGGCEQ